MGAVMACWAVFILKASAATFYVNQNCANPSPPYADWSTAATNIQTAINISSAGDVVWVTNGVYGGGGLSMDGVLTNSVSVNKAIVVQSVNGPGFTAIQGAWDPVSTNGPGAVRCAWVTNGATLSGFTLQGGATRGSGSGSYSKAGGGVYGYSTKAMILNCVLVTNSAYSYGGGAYQVTLNHCLLTGNQAFAGDGGGAANCNLTNCLITANAAVQNQGGGTYLCAAVNCAYRQNSANSVSETGGAAYGGSMANCTVTGNLTYSTFDGEAVYGANLVNCIVYGNLSNVSSPESNANYSGGTATFCCLDPRPVGTGNIDVNPQLLGDGLHLAATSPCIGAGTNRVVSGTDIDGQSWNNPPSIGCDEWKPVAMSVGPPGFGLVPAAGGNLLNFSATAAGQPPFTYFWSKDGGLIQDGPHYGASSTANLVVTNFSLADAGVYQVVISNAFGVSTSQVAQVVMHGVDAAGSNPAAPYSSWTAAATNIQDAVDAASPGDIVLVTNGIYAHGGRPYNGGITNRVLVTQPQVAILSVNGYAATIIQGAWDPNTTNGPLAVRCGFLAANNVSLTGFTLQGGATSGGAGVAWNLNSNDNVGGGVASVGEPWPYDTVSFGGVAVNDCLITSNTAGNGNGGGAAYVNLNNCILTGNTANEGGGSYNSQLTNCTVTGNQARGLGGGTSNGNLYNCISFNNTYDGWTENSWNPGGNYNLYYCCTTPTATNTGTINADPQFVDAAFHLAATSPCRGAGSSLYASGVDMDGDAWNNPPSMGAEEVNAAAWVGPLSVAIQIPQTNSFVGRSWNFTGQITGRAAGLAWAWGDGSSATNVSYATTHVWTNAGNYTVTFTAFNNDNPAGVSASTVIGVLPLIAPPLQVVGMLTNGFQFQLSGQTNANYTVQYTTNLAPPVTWNALQTIYNSPGGQYQVTDATATNGTRFYRVLAQ
jgi:hypothetical protein